jgi:hypothetical protein
MFLSFTAIYYLILFVKKKLAVRNIYDGQLKENAEGEQLSTITNAIDDAAISDEK